MSQPVDPTILSGLVDSGAQVAVWCTFCASRPASGSVGMEVEPGINHDFPACDECIENHL